MAGKAVIHNINYFGDRCACGWYRLGFPAMALHTLLNGEYRFQSTDTENVILDCNFESANILNVTFKDCNIVNNNFIKAKMQDVLIEGGFKTGNNFTDV